jgi:hypothetical protein
MDPFIIGSGISAAANLFGGMAAGDAQEAAANKAYAAQKEALIKMQEMLESVGIPSVEAQRIVLERPDYAGDLIAEKLGPSALADVQESFRTRDAQMDALRQLQELGEVGLTAEERAQRSEMMRQSAAQQQAQQQGILQSMAQRGNLDSGASLIAQLQSSAQQGADARRQSEALAADVEGRRRQAILDAAGLSSQIGQREYDRMAKAAGAEDLINKFNVQTSNLGQERNLDRQQSYQNMLSDIANRQEMYNKGLLQQDYQNRLQRTQGMAGITGQMGQAQANQAMQAGAAQAGQYAGMGSAVGNVATAVGGYMAKNPNASLFGGSSAPAQQQAGYDNMKFGSAFNKAYDDVGEGGTFNWRGKDYLLKRK